jgi:hypothetical protein
MIVTHTEQTMLINSRKPPVDNWHLCVSHISLSRRRKIGTCTNDEMAAMVDNVIQFFAVGIATVAIIHAYMVVLIEKSKPKEAKTLLMVHNMSFLVSIVSASQNTPKNAESRSLVSVFSYVVSTLCDDMLLVAVDVTAANEHPLKAPMRIHKATVEHTAAAIGFAS